MIASQPARCRRLSNIVEVHLNFSSGETLVQGSGSGVTSPPASANEPNRRSTV